VQHEMAATPQAQQNSVRIEIDAVADALRQGTRATVQEMALTKRPWRFPLSDVKTPVHLWHGPLVRPRRRPRPQQRDHGHDFVVPNDVTALSL
jgi:hypothetical protein